MRWEMISTAPARIMGLTDRGQLRPGQRADLVVMNPNTRRIEATIAGGRIQHATRDVRTPFDRHPLIPSWPRSNPMSYAAAITQELRHIRPHDLLELDHLGRAQAWVASGAPLCRLRPPATPPMHLVSYFPVMDHGYILLGAHITSGLWLPPGGHVDMGEHPRDTVRRECMEEAAAPPCPLPASHAVVS